MPCGASTKLLRKIARQFPGVPEAKLCWTTLWNTGEACSSYVLESCTNLTTLGTLLACRDKPSGFQISSDHILRTTHHKLSYVKSFRSDGSIDRSHSFIQIQAQGKEKQKKNSWAGSLEQYAFLPSYTSDSPWLSAIGHVGSHYDWWMQKE